MKPYQKSTKALLLSRSVCPEFSAERATIKTILLNDSASAGDWRDAVRNAINDGAERLIMIGRGWPTVRSVKWDGIAVIDQINVSGQNPLVGPNDEKFGTRFPDMSGLYDAELTENVIAASRKIGLTLHEGILLAQKTLTQQTILEQKLIAQNEIAVLSQDVYAGAITAKHAGRQCVGIILFSNIVNDVLDKLVAELDW